MRHILKPGLWRMDSGRWTADDGRLTVDYAPFHCHAINHFVTSRVVYTPHETFLAAVYFLFLPLCHAFNLVFSSRNLDARQRKSILGRAINYFIFFSFPWLSRHEMSISTDHRVFFIYLQDMYQIKQVEPFQRYHLFCGIWQKKSFSFCLIYIASASRNQSFRGFLVTKCRRETKEDLLYCDCVTRLVHLRRHLSYPFHDLTM